MAKVKEIKGSDFNPRQGYFTWEDENDNLQVVNGELFYNKALKRFEHELEDEYGNVTAIVYWPYEL